MIQLLAKDFWTCFILHHYSLFSKLLQICFDPPFLFNGLPTTNHALVQLVQKTVFRSPVIINSSVGGSWIKGVSLSFKILHFFSSSHLQPVLFYFLLFCFAIPFPFCIWRLISVLNPWIRFTTFLLGADSRPQQNKAASKKTSGCLCSRLFRMLRQK